MVGRDNVTFTFKIDSAKAQQTLKQLETLVRKVGGEAVNTKTKIQGLGVGITDTGNKAAASAVNFQTATQGLLNLSTAAVQTFTSISNLDRANNRAKQSVIAVARAEDLLNNKIQRRNEMEKAGLATGMKYANINREIATAEADLTVKIEKRGIEQAAVNDIYMLFATNIANVTVSSMQTLAVLDQKQILLTKAKIVQQKISNLSMFNGAKAAYAHAAAVSMQGKAAVVTTGSTLTLTGAVKALTAASKAFVASNKLLMAAVVAATAIYAVHESNILGTKDALDKLLGVEGSFQSEVDKSRESVDGLTESMTGQKRALIQLPENYRLTIRELQNIRKEYGLVAETVENTNTQLSINKQLVGSGFRSGGITPQTTGIKGFNSSLSNVIYTEGDQVFTARSISSQAVSYDTPTQVNRLSAAGITTAYSPSVVSSSSETPWNIKLMQSATTGMISPYAPGVSSQQQKPIITTDTGAFYRKDSFYDFTNIFDPTTSVSRAFTKSEKDITEASKFLATEAKIRFDRISSRVTPELVKFNEWAESINLDINLPTTLQEAGQRMAVNLETGYTGLSLQEKQWEQIKYNQRLEMEKLRARIGTGGHFVAGVGAISSSGDEYGVGTLYGTAGVESAILSLEQARKVGPAQGESQADFDLRMASYQIQIDVASSQPIRMAVQDLISKSTIRDMGGFGATAEERDKNITEFMEREKKRLDDEKRAKIKSIASDIYKKQKEEAAYTVLFERARDEGLSIEESVKRHALITAGTDIALVLQGENRFISPEDLKEFGYDIALDEKTKASLSDILASFKGVEYNVPEKVKQARKIRERLEAGDTTGLPTDTPFDRLVKDTYGRKGGVTFSSADPRFKDISEFGENRAEIFTKRMIDKITGEYLGMMGVDIGRVADSISLEEGFRIAQLQSELSGFNARSVPLAATPMFIKNISDNPFTAKFGDVVHADFIKKAREARDAAELETRLGGRADEVMSIITKAGKNYRKMQTEHALGGMKFGAGFFKSTGATAAYQVPRGSIKRHQSHIDAMKERDRLANLRRFGGYSSRKEFIEAGKRKTSEAFKQAQIFADYFSGIGRVSSYTGMSDLRGQLGGIKQRADTIKNALSSAGLSYKRFNARTGLPYRHSAHQYYQYMRDWNAVRAYNDNQYAKAKQINILQQDFGLTGFTGSALTLPSLQDEVAKQDELIKSIGLDRTEAFQIVDTEGRGREEIDDRIRFKDRMSSMSTGVSVL